MQSKECTLKINGKILTYKSKSVALLWLHNNKIQCKSCKQYKSAESFVKHKQQNFYNLDDFECSSCRLSKSSSDYMNKIENKEKYSKICSDMNKNNWNNSEYRIKRSVSSRIIAKNMFNNFETRAKIAKGHAVKKYSSLKKLSFYICSINEDDEVLKIGITSDIKNRNNAFKYLHKYTYKDILYTLDLDTNKAINFEYLIKLNFCLRDYELGNEFISVSDKEKVLSLLNDVVIKLNS